MAARCVVRPDLLLVGKARAAGTDQRGRLPVTRVGELRGLCCGIGRGNVDPRDADRLYALELALRVFRGEVRGEVREVQAGAVPPPEPPPARGGGPRASGGTLG